MTDLDIYEIVRGISDKFDKEFGEIGKTIFKIGVVIGKLERRIEQLEGV